MKISFCDLVPGEGVRDLKNFSGIPDSQGVLRSWKVVVPPFDCAVYYAAFQKFDPMNPDLEQWPDGANRVQPLKIKDFNSLKYGGLFMLFKLANQDYLAILPMSGPQTIAWFSSGDGNLILNLGNLGTAKVEGDLPLYAWARGTDPYKCCKKVWEAAVTSQYNIYSTRLREEKHYPEIFEYLGWCSWEEYKTDINEKLLVEAVSQIESSDVPIRYILVDDGHLDAEENQLKSFEPNAEKFPNGWGKLLSLRKSEKIKWMGLWLNMNGYWNGVNPRNCFDDLNKHFFKTSSGTMQPKGNFIDSLAFYDAMIGHARREGFDFVKVDNQAKNLKLADGWENSVECAVQHQQALEMACSHYMDGLINCMAHGPVCTFNTRSSAVTRCSEDYVAGDIAKARRHIHNSYGNIPWIGQTVWGDHDMFHSSDQVSSEIMAVSKAMSGGPVYLSDSPRSFQTEYIMPLCFEDGKLLRPLAPAAPFPESLFINPFTDGKPFVVIAPLTNGAAAVCAYNLTEPVVPVDGTISPDNYRYASCMLQNNSPTWEPSEEGLLLYDCEAAKACRLTGDYKYRLESFSHILFLMCPIHNDWAVIGRTDKYLSPSAVEVIDASYSELIIKMIEMGPLTIWSQSGTLYSEDVEIESLGNGLWKCYLPVEPKQGVIKIRRH